MWAACAWGGHNTCGLHVHGEDTIHTQISCQLCTRKEQTITKSMVT